MIVAKDKHIKTKKFEIVIEKEHSLERDDNKSANDNGKDHS